MNWSEIEAPPEPDLLFAFYSELQDYVGWTADDARRVRKCGPLVQQQFRDLIDDFYDEIKRHPNAVNVIRGGEQQIARLKRTLLNWIDELFTRDYDRDYVASRWQVGRRHVLVGLDQTYATAALSRLGQGMLLAITENWQGSEDECRLSCRALEKLLSLENAIISAAYQSHFASHLQSQANQQIKQSERLASIGQMITGLAHESRNILQRSHACLAALMLDIGDLPDASNQAMRIQAALDRLQMLYEEVRNYAAPIKLDLARVDLARLVAGVWQNLQPHWQPGKILFQMLVESEMPETIWADRFRLEQVFTNLLNNAIDASEQQGSIACRLKLESSGTIVVRIEDEGAGIPVENHQRIFEPFFTTKPKGTGLGLAITKRIVEAHGADIRILNQEKSGTIFEIRFPLESYQQKSSTGLE